MSVELSVPFIGLIIAILLHAFATIWWASKITNQITTLNSSLDRIDKELAKRDIQISALWKRLDEVRDLITGK